MSPWARAISTTRWTSLRGNELPFMPAPPDTYYEKVDARVPGHGEPVDN